MGDSGCVTPHFFESVEFPVLRQHHMHHHIHIIDQYPLQVVEAFLMEWFFITDLFHHMPDIIPDGSYLGHARCITNDEEISYRLGYFAEIERNNMFPFFLLYRFNDCPDDLRPAGQPPFNPFAGGQAFSCTMGQRYQFFQIMKVFWVLIVVYTGFLRSRTGVFFTCFRPLKNRGKLQVPGNSITLSKIAINCQTLPPINRL